MYDAGGRAVQTIFADSTSIKTTYDQLGRRVASTDQLGWLTEYEHDLLGNLTAVVLPPPYVGGGFVLSHNRARYEYAYDDNGNLAKVKDPLGRETKYEYDELGRKVKATLPMGQSETWRYDSLGRMDRHVDFNGKVEKFAYDSLGRLATDSFHDSEAGAAVDTITYSYDAYALLDGVRKDAVVDSRHGTTERYFDREGRMIKIVTPEGTIRYEYDPATGRKTRVYTADTVAAANTDIAYQYDDGGRLWKVTTAKLNGSAAALATEYAYNLLDQPVSTSLPNGTTETRTYDVLNRLTSVITKRDSDNATLASFAYALDAAGRLGGASPSRCEALYNDLIHDAAGNLLTQDGDWAPRAQNAWDRAGRLVRTKGRRGHHGDGTGLDGWFAFYNHERLRQSLAHRIPAEVYHDPTRVSPRGRETPQIPT